MHNIDEINSILNAVNEINLKSKIKDINFGAEKNSIPKLNQDLKVSPDVDKIIKEAEEYKKMDGKDWIRKVEPLAGKATIALEGKILKLLDKKGYEWFMGLDRNVKKAGQDLQKKIK